MMTASGFGKTRKEEREMIKVPELKDLASLAAPEAIEDEWGVMSCIFSSQTPHERFLQVAQVLEPKHFGLPIIQDIWRAMLEMHTKRLPIAYQIFNNYLTDFHMKNKAFFEQLLPKMYETTHEEEHILLYAERIRQYYYKRSLMGVFAQGISAAANHAQPEDALAEAERKILEMKYEVHGNSKRGGSSFRRLAQSYLSDLKEQAAGKKASGTIQTTSWYDFNQAAQGFAPGDFIIVAAPTSCGKSMTGIGMAREFAMGGHYVLYESLEMTQRTVLERLMAPAVGFSAGSMTRTGTITDPKLKAIEKFCDEHADLPIAIKKPHQNSYDSFVKAAAEAEAEFREDYGDQFKGFRVVIVDYLQLLAANVPSQFKVQEIDRVSQLLRNYALENECTVIALAQYDTETAKAGKEPDSLNCLSYCKTVDHHATQVVMMWHPYFADRKRLHEATYIDFLWLKNRDGSNDRVRMGVDWEKGWLYSMAYGGKNMPEPPQKDKNFDWTPLQAKYGKPEDQAQLPESEEEPIVFQSDDPNLAPAKPKGADAALVAAQVETSSEAIEVACEVIQEPLLEDVIEVESVEVPEPANEELEVANETEVDAIFINGDKYCVGEVVNFSTGGEITTAEIVGEKLSKDGSRVQGILLRHLESKKTDARTKEFSGKDFFWQEGQEFLSHPNRISKR